MNRSFYSSQRVESFSKTFNRPEGYRVLVKKRSNHATEQIQPCHTSSLKNDMISTGKFSTKKQKQTETFSSSKKSKISKDEIKELKEKIQLAEMRMRSTSRSKASEPICRYHSEGPLTLLEIQDRIERLIQVKLQKIKSFRTFKSSVKEKDEIDLELERLVEMLSFLDKNEASDISSEIQESLDTINLKITMLEKIIAESNTESEMIKKYFHAKRVSRKRQKKNNFNFKSVDFLRENGKFNTNNSQSIHFSSIAKTSFKSPSKNDYPQKGQKPAFISNNQPLPRSTYNRQFLMYGVLPKFAYKSSESNILGSSSNLLNRSSYQADFTEKKAKRIDFKELDCFRDKFKNLKVTLNQDQKNSPLKTETPTYFHSNEKKLPEVPFIKNLMSESKLNYDKKLGKMAVIKHQNLTKLKYNYKATVHA